MGECGMLRGMVWLRELVMSVWVLLLWKVVIFMPGSLQHGSVIKMHLGKQSLKRQNISLTSSGHNNCTTVSLVSISSSINLYLSLTWRGVGLQFPLGEDSGCQCKGQHHLYKHAFPSMLPSRERNFCWGLHNLSWQKCCPLYILHKWLYHFLRHLENCENLPKTFLSLINLFFAVSYWKFNVFLQLKFVFTLDLCLWFWHWVYVRGHWFCFSP